MGSTRFALGVAGLVALAIALRGWIFADCHDWIALREPILDAAAYHQHALGLLAGTWPGDQPYFFGPGYSYLLSGVYRLFGAEVLVGRIAQAGLGVLLVAVVSVLGRRVGGEKAGWVAGAFALLHAPFLAFEQWLLLDTVLTVGAVLAVAWALRLGDRGTTVLSGLALGVLFGGLVALRGTSVLYAIPLGIAIGARARPLPIAAAVVATLAVLAPFAWHNHEAGSRALLGTNLGLNLYIGNHANASGMFAYPSGWMGSEDLSGQQTATRLTGSPLTSDGTNEFWLDLTRREVAANPGATLLRGVKKAYLFLQRDDIPQNENIAFFVRNVFPARLAVVGWWMLLPLAVFGAWAGRRERATRTVVAAALVPLAVAMAFFVTGRYRLPATPFVMVLAARGAIEMVSVRPISVVRVVAVAAGWLALLSLPRPFDAAAALAREYEHVGLRYQDAGNVHAAEDQYRRSLEVDANHGDAWNNLGVLYASTDRLDAAEEAYRRAAALEPENPVPLQNLAMLLGGQERDAEAADAFRLALEVTPHDADLRVNLGTALARLGQLDAAVAEFRAVLTRNPNHARAREMLLSAEELRQALREPQGDASQ